MSEFTFGGKTIGEIAAGVERDVDPYTYELDGLVLWRAQFGFQMAALSPEAQMRVSGITDGIPITYTPPRPPLWTRHMSGVTEAERDRRLQRRGY